MKPADDKDFSSTKSILNGIEKKLPKKFTLSPDEKEYCFTLRLTGWELGPVSCHRRIQKGEPMKSEKDAYQQPEIWLRENEMSGKFDDCNCRLEAEYAEEGTNGSPAFFMCPLHAAAPDLLEALKEILNSTDCNLDEQSDETSEAMKHAYAVMDKAEGKV